MRRRFRILAAAGLLAPSCANPTAHRGRAQSPVPPREQAGPDATAANVATSTGPAATSPEGATGSTAGVPGIASVPTVPSGPTVTFTAPHSTTTTTLVLPEQVDEDLADEEWAEQERMAGPRALASWYGSESGSHTANGEPYDPSGLTFAHRSMAFGSRVRFCGPLGCVVATCTDRGPAAWTGKTFDLSRGAFARVAPLSAGVAELAWEVIG